MKEDRMNINCVDYTLVFFLRFFSDARESRQENQLKISHLKHDVTQIFCITIERLKQLQ